MAKHPKGDITYWGVRDWIVGAGIDIKMFEMLSGKTIEQLTLQLNNFDVELFLDEQGRPWIERKSAKTLILAGRGAQLKALLETERHFYKDNVEAYSIARVRPWTCSGSIRVAENPIETAKRELEEEMKISREQLRSRCFSSELVLVNKDFPDDEHESTVFRYFWTREKMSHALLWLTEQLWPDGRYFWDDGTKVRQEWFPVEAGCALIPDKKPLELPGLLAFMEEDGSDRIPALAAG